MAGIPLQEWDAVADLIEEALARTESERLPFLRAACAGDEERLSTAERLLASAQAAQVFLAEPASVVVADLLREAVAESGPLTADPPQPVSIGPYRIVRELGRGGMGIVYLAERDDEEYRREVAIKIVRWGIAAPETAQRFRRERQILASLDHPGIARLYDGGVTQDGRPYLIMEVVTGEPIDVYCDKRRLDIEQRIDLFHQVAAAVAFAHRKLVVHRDLKPGNILVDANGTVKLLDFGVARLLESDDGADTGASAITRAGIRILTPEYASPEQFTGAPVTTATDIYSLGVLLFELLTGVRPHGSTNPRAIERAVVEGDPERPSLLLARSHDADLIARNRGATHERLQRQLSGDLDTIVLEALRKEPEARYASVDALIEDLRRHRERHPIIARPQTWSYRASRFLRRHRLAVTMGMLLGVSLVAGAATTLWQARAIGLEARKAEQIRDFLVSVFEISDPDQSRGERVTARELLDRGAERIDNELSDQPELRAGLLGVLGNVYQRLGLYDDALPHLEEALVIHRSGNGTEADLGASLRDLAALRFDRGEYESAETLQREALELEHRRGGTTSPMYAATALDLAATLRARAEYDSARTFYEVALRIRQNAGDSIALADVLNGLGLMYMDAGESEEAVVALERATGIHSAALGTVHTETARSTCNLASAYSAAGRYEDARARFTDCLAARRTLLEPDHPDIGRTLNNLAIANERLDDLVAADSLHRQALEIRRHAFGAVHPEVAGSLNNIAVLSYRRGDYDAAATAFADLIAQWRSLLGEDHPNTLASSNNLGMVLSAAGDYPAAESVLRETLDRRRVTLGTDHPAVGESFANLASVLLHQRRFREAETQAMQAATVLEAAFPEGHPSTASALSVMGRALHGQGRCSDAISHFERAVAIRRDRLGEQHAVTADAQVWLGRCLILAGRATEAETVLEAAVTTLVGIHGEGHASVSEARAALAEAVEGR